MPWTKEEDELLEMIERHAHWRLRDIPNSIDLKHKLWLIKKIREMRAELETDGDGQR